MCTDAEGRRYIALELVEGGSLADRFNGMPQEPRKAARWIESIARAVQVAHDHGIVHGI